MEGMEIFGAVREIQETWAEIAEAIKSGAEFNMGDYKKDRTLDGQEFTMVVTDVTDEYVRFDSRNCVGRSVVWNKEDSENLCYPESDVHSYLNNELFEHLPEELRKVISLTERKTLCNGEIITFKTRLFLPTATEVLDELDQYGDEGTYEQMKYYRSDYNKVKSYDDEDEKRYTWWLATVGSGVGGACAVFGSGYPECVIPSLSAPVPVCFVINRS